MQYREAKKYILQRLKDELPAHLFYHGLHHTLDIVNSAVRIGEATGISGYEMRLLKTAALFHDSGFIISEKNHELESCKLVQQTLPTFGYTQEEIRRICGMIMATRIPQDPKNLLEKILCDADLDYLGRDDYIPISTQLLHELNHSKKLSETDWLNTQVKFLEAHHYFTDVAKKERKSGKDAVLRSLKSALRKIKP